MRTISKTVYQYSELSESAKLRALEWYRNGALDYDWWEYSYEDFQTICEILGLYDVKPQFSGFCCQGDGASFSGRFAYGKQSAKRIREHAPQDKELHRIADSLASLQKRYFYKLVGTIEQRGRYSHDCTMYVDSVENSDTGYSVDASNQLASEFQDTFQDLAKWLYRQLESEHDYLLSDEVCAEAIESNSYEFDESGSRC
jgi:hypothetical protein